MITVDKYIRKLLFEHDCVIIPEFGGLLTHHVGAHYDATIGVFQPARKRLAFNEVLKIDDGLLTYYVAAHEKISREEAVGVVKRYVDSLRQELLAGDPVHLEAIGTISMNTEGRLVFEPDYSFNYNSEWFGMQSFAVREVVRETLFEEHGSEDLFEYRTELVPDIETTGRRSNWLSWAAAAVLVGAVTLLSISTSSNNSSLLSTLNPFETVRDLTLDSYTPAPAPAMPLRIEAPKTKATPVEVVAYIPKSEIQEETNQRKDTPTLDNIKVATPITAPAVPAISVKEVKTTNRYYLIAGSFGSMKNAEILRRELNNKGFSESSVLSKAGGKLIKVSAGSYASMESAMNHKRKVDAATGADSWVYHRR